MATITTTPATARIVSLRTQDDTVVLGTGTATFPLKGDAPVPIVVIAEGYVPVRVNVTKENTNGTPMKVPLKTRVVQLTVLPFGAGLKVNESPRTPASGPVLIDQGKQVHVEATLAGFKSVVRDYFNLPDKELPPIRETLELTERAVIVSANSESASIYADGKLVGTNGRGEVLIPKGTCITVRAELPGFVPSTKQLCQRDGMAPPGLDERLTLVDRLSKVTVSPPSADIYLEGRKVGVGEYSVSIRQDDCVQLRVVAPAFIPKTQALCNKRNYDPPKAEETLRLEPDDSWQLTYQSDQANKDFTIEVGLKRNADDVWKTLTQVITSQFDVLETTDKATGYLRTGWNVRRTPNWTYRTRMIVKLADSNPLKYTVKLVSEQAFGDVRIQDDEKFEPRDRILLQYKDLINEIQSRLR
jgi:hypothetical protein